MNVAVINLKDILKYFAKILIAIFIIFIAMQYISNSGKNLKEVISNKTNNKFLRACLQISIPMLKNNEKHEAKITNLMNMEIAMLNPPIEQREQENIDNHEQNDELNLEQPQVSENTLSPQVEIAKIAKTRRGIRKKF